jgi:CRISPR-associated protein Csb3
MNEFVLGSKHTRALDHFAGFGLSAILEQAGERHIRLHWSCVAEPRLTLSGLRSEPEQVAAVVHAHALAHCVPESWVQRTATVTSQRKPMEVGLFSPRISIPDRRDTWRDLHEKRSAALDFLANQEWIDSMMLQALGEPAYWLLDTQTAEPDRGASRWEMITRTHGKDFTRYRLVKLAGAVSARTAGTVLAGLVGDVLVDEIGDNKTDSRTGTGLVPPGPVDNALAWCALWGLSAFRVTHRIGRQSFTPGAYPQTRVHPDEMALPLVTSPTTPAKLRRILRSRVLHDAAFAPKGSSERATGREALNNSRAAGLVRFPVRRAGGKAPERQVLNGVFEFL